MNTKDEQAMISRIVDLEKRVKTLTAERNEFQALFKRTDFIAQSLGQEFAKAIKERDELLLKLKKPAKSAKVAPVATDEEPEEPDIK